MRRENSKPSASMKMDSLFQSAPAAMRRENPVDGSDTTKPRSFNPLPPQCGGRIRGRQSQGQRHQVSIRSRRNAAGEYTNGEYDAHRILVSIRSRRNAAGESRRLKVVQAELTFQSAPAAMRRENIPPLPGNVKRKSFNPLPPQCGGRMAFRAAEAPGIRVSIRSRRNAAGEFPLHRLYVEPFVVSIRSRRNAAGEFRSARKPAKSGLVSIRSRRNAAGESSSVAESIRSGNAAVLRRMFQSAPAAMRRENSVTRTPSCNGVCIHVFAYLDQNKAQEAGRGKYECATPVQERLWANREGPAFLVIAPGPRKGYAISDPSKSTALSCP